MKNIESSTRELPEVSNKSHENRSYLNFSKKLRTNYKQSNEIKNLDHRTNLETESANQKIQTASFTEQRKNEVNFIIF